ncbi:hypothetical protein AWM70_19340 [Paenibacillus yonginensis]|uniref:Methyltransferase domain-containing protein n=1 Tax=Paenibacillus yonginensis TaxID=1462996 RepID=A0A1B1N4V0_9BACL|nr:hypothetical protein [Paenibacillus yonginensis]ANS76460.1 hypothetical protein AWM70_19340 [Paenibacillus yonginensis]
MNLFKRRVHVPYAKIRNANTLRNHTTRHDWEHWSGYREQIRRVLEQTLTGSGCGRGHLLLLGAGNGNDVPISFIESVFERITIVDIDEKALDRLLAKAEQPGKFSKAIIDLTGIGNEVQTLGELKEKAASLTPSVDFSKLKPPFDVVMNLCFSSQLISAFFYKENSRTLYTPEFGAQLDRLIERIHVSIFDGLHERLMDRGVVIHLTDVLLLQQLKKTGSLSPARLKAEALTEGRLRDNLGQVYKHLSEFAQAGLCLPGTFAHLQKPILEKFKLHAEYTLLWDFVDDDHEDRDYLVTAHVLENKTGAIEAGR